MKILAQINPKSGSDFHRKIQPLQSLNVDFAEELTTELIQNYDILWINRNCNTSAATLSIWRETFGIRIIYDLDDSLIIPDNYPNAEIYKKALPLVKDKLIVADYVTVSTSSLIEEVKPYNSNIKVIHNRINYNEDILKKEEYTQFLNRKIRVGLIGAFTHYNDWKEIKGWLTALVNNLLFKQECEFIIAGYDKSTHKYFQEFASLGKIAHQLPPHQYLRLLHEFDIILCPLQDNELNKKKSSLRILEAAVGNAVCILDPLYKNKTDCPDVGHLYVSKEKDWLNLPLELIKDRDKLWKLKESTGIKTRNLNFQEVIKQREELHKEVLTIKPDELRYHIYSIKYKPEQAIEYFPYFNQIKTIEEKSYLFEYNAILKIVPLIPNDYQDFVLVLSWKFPGKTRLFKRKVQQILDKNQKYDCINFCNSLDQPYLKFTEKQHPGFMNLFRQICNDLGLPTKEPSNTIYSNFFALKAPLYKEYVQLLEKAIELLETKYKEEVWKDANYKSGLPKETLKENTGLDYYTFHTFILERLVGQWIDKNNIKVLNIMK